MNDQVDLSTITDIKELKAMLCDQYELMDQVQANVRAIQVRRQELEGIPAVNGKVPAEA